MKKSTRQSAADLLIPNPSEHMQPVVNTSEVKSWSLSHDLWKTNSKRGNWEASNTCSSSRALGQILEEGISLSGDSCQQDTGAMCVGWHMVLGIMLRYAAGLEPGTVHCTIGLGRSY